jgi:hypothetical protein
MSNFLVAQAFQAVLTQAKACGYISHPLFEPTRPEKRHCLISLYQSGLGS